MLLFLRSETYNILYNAMVGIFVYLFDRSSASVYLVPEWWSFGDTVGAWTLAVLNRRTRRTPSRRLARVGVPVTSLPATCRLTVFAGLASALAATALVAHAQVPRGDQPIPESRQGETVASRPRPDFDPRGARTGSFLIFPKLTITAISDDNIFSESTNEVEDSLAVVSPGVEVRSVFSRHALNLNTRADIGRYADEDSEDYDDFTLGIDGRLDIRRTTNVFGGVDFRELHEDRGSPDDVNGISPTEFDVGSANVGYFQRFGRLSVQLQGIFDQYDFDDTPATFGVINNDDRDRDESRALFRFGYEIVPNYEAVFSARYNRIDYDSPVGDDGFNRDSDGQEFAAGVAIEFTNVTSAELLVGNVTQDFDDVLLENINDSEFRLGVTWNVTRLTTIQAFAVRNLEQTTVVGASAILQSRTGISVDHELRRNLLINLGLTATEQDFVGIDRTDRLDDAIVGVKWLINPKFFAGIRYSFRDRDPDVPTEEFKKNRLMIQLGGQI